jgi:hypothetical protein
MDWVGQVRGMNAAAKLAPHEENFLQPAKAGFVAERSEAIQERF